MVRSKSQPVEPVVEEEKKFRGRPPQPGSKAYMLRQQAERERLANQARGGDKDEYDTDLSDSSLSDRAASNIPSAQ